MKILVNGKIEVEWDGKLTSCRGCGAQIGWGITNAMKRMPFDVVFDGVPMIDEKNNKVHGSIDLDKCVAHWSTCKVASHFKRGKK
jgi:phage-related protein